MLCVEVFEHLGEEEREPALREMVRVLRPGGRLILTFPADDTALELDRWLDDAYRARHGEPHPWVAEHLAEGLRERRGVRRAEARAAGRGHGCDSQAPAGAAFRALHGVYTVYGGTVWTGRFALGRRWRCGRRSGPAEDAAGPAYRTVLVLDKP